MKEGKGDGSIYYLTHPLAFIDITGDLYITLFHPVIMRFNK